MAKRRRVVIAPTPIREAHRRDPVKEARNRRLIIGSIAAVLVVAVVISGVGYYRTYFGPPRRTALSVGERSFSAADLATRAKLDIADNAGEDPQKPTVPDLDTIVKQMEDEEVARQTAGDIGITTSTDEVNASIGERLGVDFGGPGTPFDRAYRDELNRSGLNDDEYHQLIQADVIEKKVQAIMTDAVPESSDQVEGQVILVPSEEEAKTVLERLKGKPEKAPAGGRGNENTVVERFVGAEDFSTVATSASRDTETASTGGNLDWTPYGVLDPQIEKTVFALDKDKISDPIQGADGFWIVKVTGRRQGAAVDDTQRQALVKDGYRAWLDHGAEALHAETFLDDDMRAWVLSEALS